MKHMRRCLPTIVVLAALLVSCGQRSNAGSDDLGAVGQAEDATVQIQLQQALVAAKTMYVATGSYASADSSTGGLVTEDPSMCYVGATTPSVATGATCQAGRGAASISISATAGSWAAAMMSVSGNCVWIKDTPSGTKFGSGSPCTGAAAQGA
jgi:hypothetical protein